MRDLIPGDIAKVTSSHVTSDFFERFFSNLRKSLREMRRERRVIDRSTLIRANEGQEKKEGQKKSGIPRQIRRY